MPLAETAAGPLGHLCHCGTPHTWAAGCPQERTGIQASREPSWLRAGVRQRFWEPHLLTELFPSHSGVIGSGLCVFSRFPILDTLLYQYSLNGYPYMVSGEGSTWHRGVHPHRASVALTCPSSPWAAPAWGLVLRQVRRSRRYENLRDHLQRLRHPCEHLREEPSMGGTVGRRGVSGHTPLSLSPCFNHCCLPSVLDYAPI